MMIQESEDMFIRTSGGLYVAWSLSVPSIWSDWVLVEVMVSHGGQFKHEYHISSVIPYRAMGKEEVQALRRRSLLFWGMKVANAP